MLQHPGRPVERAEHVAVDVVERLTGGRVVHPAPGVAVGQSDRAPGLQPGRGVDERAPVGGLLRVQLQPVDPLGLGGDPLGQLGQRDLGAGPAQHGQRQRQVGVAAPVERSVRRTPAIAGWLASSASRVRNSRAVVGVSSSR